MLLKIVGEIILYHYNSMLFGVAVIMLLLYGVVVFAFNKPIKEINRKQMEDNFQLTSYLIESLNGIQTVKSFNVKKIKTKNRKKFIKLLKSIFKGGMINNFRGSITYSINLFHWSEQKNNEFSDYYAKGIVDSNRLGEMLDLEIEKNNE